MPPTGPEQVQVEKMMEVVSGTEEVWVATVGVVVC